MCGRFTLITPARELARELGLPYETVLAGLEPRYNIAPSQLVPVLLAEGGVHMALFQWGLIPHWAKDPSVGNRMINARGETITEKPSFRRPFMKRRCLVLADGFFEWHEKEKGRAKTPYYIRLKSRKPFTFAGVWSSWTSPSGVDVLTCTIITGEANELIAKIHQRMPVIVPPGMREVWLDPENQDTESLRALLKPFAPEEMEMFPVSRHVNSPRNDDPFCVEPAEDMEAKGESQR
jgi:putative SOS response-associated peptidase YedK